MKNQIEIYIKKFNIDEQKQMHDLINLVKSNFDTEEVISYGMPSFKWKGKILCSFAMNKNHLGYYPNSGSTVNNFKDDLKGYTTTKASVHFSKDKPLPKKLIKTLLDCRAKEILDSNIYYFVCPKGLGYLNITLDKSGLVSKCEFSNKKTPLKASANISSALDKYFKNKINLPKSLVSKNISGTDFQKLVWREISKIPFAKNMSYKEIADKIGQTNAVRAVGTACGKNPVALFVPCHRVQSSSGKNTGYAWGKERKDWLLGFENKS